MEDSMTQNIKNLATGTCLGKGIYKPNKIHLQSSVMIFLTGKVFLAGTFVYDATYYTWTSKGGWSVAEFSHIVKQPR
uniref:Uncharacterized protein n=1 Tax=Megaselia scalaris TaxID=36166 RepID=T1GW93_MEGSC